MADTTFKAVDLDGDPYQDTDADNRERKFWMEKYFGEYQSPSARGGFEELNDPPGYYNNRPDGPGCRSCLTCSALVYGYDFYDVEYLNVHRAFHDKLGF